MYMHRRTKKANTSHLPVAERTPHSYVDIIEKHHEKHALITFRNNLLNRQANANYVNEYDRIRGILASNVVTPHGSMDRLKARAAELKHLAGGALN